MYKFSASEQLWRVSTENGNTSNSKLHLTTVLE